MNEIIEQPIPDLRTVASEAGALILDAGSMDSIIRLADIMAKGRATVPSHFQGNSADCAAVIMQSIQWKMNPFAVAQKTHIVNGILGYEAQLVNAVIQSSGVTLDRFNYDWFGAWENIIGKSKVVDKPASGKYGEKDYKKATQYRLPDYDMNDEDGLGICVSATLRGETEPRTLKLLLVQASVRNSPLWATDPKQQLAYLAVKRWTRLYAPDVILGVYSPDELSEDNPKEVDITPKETAQAKPATAEPSAALLAQAETAARSGVTTYQQFWKAAGINNRNLLKQHHEGFKDEADAADKKQTSEAAADPVKEQAKPITQVTAAAMDSFDAGLAPTAEYVPE
jgi:hypothetical protein